MTDIDRIAFIESLFILRPDMESVSAIGEGGSLDSIQWGDVPPVTEEELLPVFEAKLLEGQFRALRNARDVRLADSDWTQMPDSPLTDSRKVEWANYRQALRDLPGSTADPDAPVWPTPPA